MKWKDFRELHSAKRNIEINEIPKAKDEYVRQHIDGYKMHLRTKDANNLIEAYIKSLEE